jgi:hypothetical protein
MDNNYNGFASQPNPGSDPSQGNNQSWQQDRHTDHHGDHHPHHENHHGHHQDHQNQPVNLGSSWQQAKEPFQAPPPPAAPENSQFYQPQPQFVSPAAGQYAQPQQPFQQPANGLPTNDVNPVAVVPVLSTRGVEYWMLTLTLWLGAGGLLAVLLALFNGGTSFEVLAFPVSLLIVCLPVFSYFFLRLKKAELMNPQLRLDPSKRRLTQFTQVITFAISLFTLVVIVFGIIAAIGGHGPDSFGKFLLNSFLVLLVSGGILAYYWIDEHQGR